MEYFLCLKMEVNRIAFHIILLPNSKYHILTHILFVLSFDVKSFLDSIIILKEKLKKINNFLYVYIHYINKYKKFYKISI